MLKAASFFFLKRKEVPLGTPTTEWEDNNKMKNRDAGYEYVNWIILTSDIHIVNSCKADDSLINATYLITTSTDINWYEKVTLIAFSRQEIFAEK